MSQMSQIITAHIIAQYGQPSSLLIKKTRKPISNTISLLPIFLSSDTGLRPQQQQQQQYQQQQQQQQHSSYGGGNERTSSASPSAMPPSASVARQQQLAAGNRMAIQVCYSEELVTRIFQKWPQLWNDLSFHSLGKTKIFW
jgi:hypothetical protein